jgi:hypothetical protein
MNIFGFITIEAVNGLLAMSFIGIFFGFLLGFIKYLLFAFMRKKPSWSSWGNEGDHGKEVKKYG